MKVLKWVIEFAAIFIGLCLADLINRLIPAKSWILEMATTVALVVAMMYAAEFINSLIAKNKKDK